MTAMKPSDFFMGVVEFFAVLLPGGALVYLARPWVSGLVPSLLWPRGSTEGWAAFLTLAYIMGHLLHAFSSRLDKALYDRLYLRRMEPAHYRAVRAIRENNDTLKDVASTLVARAHFLTGASSSGTTLYDWCLSFVRLRQQAAAAEVDRHQADSKFFRSLTFVLLAAAVAMAASGSLALAAAALLMTIFSAWRFCTLRWDATKRVYEYYLLLHPNQPVQGDLPKDAC